MRDERPQTRRVVRVILAREVMSCGLFHTTPEGEYLRCTEGLPPGTRWVAAGLDPMTGDVVMFFEHESFEPVPLGMVPPEFHPVFTRYTRPLWPESGGETE